MAGVEGILRDMIEGFPELEELFFPQRVEQDLTSINILKNQLPIPNRLQYYFNQEVEGDELMSLPNQSAIDNFERELLISAYVRNYSEEGAHSWVDKLIEFYPEKLVLLQFIVHIRNENFTSKQILMLVLERPEITNNEILVVGW